jgi:iron complex outermembrane receptor protein
MKIKSLLLAAVAASSMLPAAPACAQEAKDGAYVDNGDIVVTARKREESIMKVPVVANTLDAKQIEQFQTTDIRRVADQIPGFLVGAPASASYGAQLSLRGIGTSVLNATIDQSITLNLDSQQFTQGLAFAAGLFDLQQITVLKGPQALFFGKASPGGVVAIQSNNPTQDLELIARGGYEFESRAKQGELIVSGPLSQTLGFRIAGRYTDTDGYFRNIAPPPPSNLGATYAEPRRSQASKEVLVRGTLLWQPVDNFTARLKVTYSSNHADGRDGQLVSCPDGIAGNGGIQFIAANETCKKDRNFTIADMNPANFPGILDGGRQFANVEQAFGVFEMNYRPSAELTLTSVTGYYHVADQDQFSSAGSSVAGTPFSASTHYTRNDFTQEVRASSDFKNSPINFTLGAFYENIGQHKLGIAILNNALPFPPVVGPVFLSDGTHDNPAESESVFGQLLWKITPTLELAGGARWTHEHREHTYFNLISQPNTPIALAVPVLNSNRVSPEVTLTWTPSEDLTIFGALKKGYKSGSFNTSGSFRNGDDSSFGDEKVKGGELGLKVRALDRALVFNLSGYYYKYQGLQVGANATSSEGIIITKVLNAASAKIYGIEGDLTYRVPGIDNLTLRAAANYNHARYGSFANAPCWGGQRVQDGCALDFNRSAASGQVGSGPFGAVFVPTAGGPATQNGVSGYYGFYTSQDLSGRALLRSPDFTATGSFDYTIPLGKKMRLTFAGDMRYSTSYYADILLEAGEKQSAYAKFGTNVTLYGPDDRWELAFIGNNLSDHLLLNRCSSSNVANGVSPFLPTPLKGGTTRNSAGVDEIICTVDTGRELWLRATIRM